MNSTNVLSVLGTVAGLTQYSASIGIQLPSSKQDWLNFALAVLLAIIGILAKGVSSNEKSSSTESTSH